MPNRKIEAIIWDLDGTLVDTDLHLILNFAHMYHKYRPGYYPHIRQILSYSGPSLTGIMADQFPNVDTKEAEDEYEQYSKDYQAQLISLYDNEMKVLKSLHDNEIKMIVMTNKRRESAIQCMHATGLSDIIPDMVAIDDVKNGKPNPEGIFESLKRLGTSKETTMIIGDSNTDIVAGANAGIVTGLVTWSLKGLPKEPRDYEFDTFDEIKEFVLDGKYNRENR